MEEINAPEVDAAVTIEQLAAGNWKEAELANWFVEWSVSPA